MTILDEAASKLTYVFDTIKLLRKQLDERDDNVALIGFTGAPWTLATYMIEGQGTKTYNLCKKMMYSNPELLHNILAKVTEVVKLYMEKQIEAGIKIQKEVKERDKIDEDRKDKVVDALVDKIKGE